MKRKLPERRQFVRVEVPLKINIEDSGREWDASTRDVSPAGLGIESLQEIKEQTVKLILYLPGEEETPVKLEGRIVWQERVSLEDNAPYRAGLEIEKIEEGKKNVFLKFLCDILYGSTYEERT